MSGRARRGMVRFGVAGLARQCAVRVGSVWQGMAGVVRPGEA